MTLLLHSTVYVCYVSAGVILCMQCQMQGTKNFILYQYYMHHTLNSHMHSSPVSSMLTVRLQHRAANMLIIVTMSGCNNYECIAIRVLEWNQSIGMILVE